jgi:hypothetical protein
VLGQQNKKKLHLECTGGYLSQKIVATACQLKEARAYWKNVVYSLKKKTKADDILGH